MKARRRRTPREIVEQHERVSDDYVDAGDGYFADCARRLFVDLASVRGPVLVPGMGRHFEAWEHMIEVRMNERGLSRKAARASLCGEGLPDDLAPAPSMVVLPTGFGI